jgi:hypothetical protein
MYIPTRRSSPFELICAIVLGYWQDPDGSQSARVVRTHCRLHAACCSRGGPRLNTIHSLLESCHGSRRHCPACRANEQQFAERRGRSFGRAKTGARRLQIPISATTAGLRSAEQRKWGGKKKSGSRAEKFQSRHPPHHDNLLPLVCSCYEVNRPCPIMATSKELMASGSDAVVAIDPDQVC